MKYPKSTTQPPMTTHAHSNGVACSVLAVLALALLCSAPNIAQCVVGTNAALTFSIEGQHVRIPTGPALAGFADFTIECAYRLSGMNFGAHDTFVSRWEPTRSYWFGFENSRALRFYWSFNGFTFASYSPPAFLVPIDSTWHYYAVSRQGGTLSILFDGQVVGSTSLNGTLFAGNSALGIGSEIDVGGDSVVNTATNGSLDEIRIWNVARSQAQILSAMTFGLVGNETGLVGYWRFDEGSGQTVFNSATATGSTLDGTLGANALPGTDDPTLISTGLPTIPYCPPCPLPPCGQVNSPCATLTVNGVGAAAQGPFNVVVPAGSTLGFNWSGPANQPYVLVAMTNLVPGQVVAPPSFVVDVNIGNFAILFSGFDPYWGQFFFTNAAGSSSQSFAIPTTLFGTTLNVQGFIYDLNQTCSDGLGFMTTASFSIQL